MLRYNDNQCQQQVSISFQPILLLNLSNYPCSNCGSYGYGYDNNYGYGYNSEGYNSVSTVTVTATQTQVTFIYCHIEWAC